jgi:prolyl oligopeptidase PreP (S9A serine peptidase family)
LAQTPDPYLWLEDVGGDRALNWVRERNTESQKVLEAEPGFATLRDSLRSVLDSREQFRMSRGAAAGTTTCGATPSTRSPAHVAGGFARPIRRRKR